MAKCATKSGSGRHFAGGGLINPLQAVGSFFNGSPSATPDSGTAIPGMSTWGGSLAPMSRTTTSPVGQPQAGMGITSRRDASPLERMDQSIAMGNAMAGLSNTERYQLDNPLNKAYSAAGAAPGSAAAASHLDRQTGIMETLRGKLAEQPLYAGYADGGEIKKETPDELMARMAKQYGTTGAGNPTPVQPAPQAIAQPTQPAPQTAPEKKGFLGGILGTIKGRKDQLDKEIDKATNGYANGGKIQGPGTPTSDSIPARVTQTGEPIAVSTGERILSKPQDNLIQLIAKGIGFDGTDAMLEEGTGKPVGPTIKSGIAHAATGAKPFWQGEDVPQLSAEGSAANKPSIESKPGYQAGPTPVIDQISQGIGRAMAGEFNGRGGMPITEAFVPNPAAEQAVGALPGRYPTAVESQDRRTGYAGRGQINPPLIGQTQPDGSDPRFTPAGVQPGMRSGQIGIGPQTAMVAGRSNVDATKLQAPQGGGYITAQGGKKAMFVPGEQTYTGTDGKPTTQWNQTQDYADALKRNEADKALLEQMERDRYGRDMGADVKDPWARLAAEKGIANLNNEQMLNQSAQVAQQQGITAGLDQSIKRNSLAQTAQEQQMISRLNDPSLTPDQRQSLRSDLLVAKGKNPNENRFLPAHNVKTYNEMGQVTGEEPGGWFDTVTQARVGGQQKAAIPKGMTEDSVIAEARAAIKAGKSASAVSAELAKYGLSLK